MDKSPAQSLVEAATAKGVKIASAESCTGGMIAAALTDVAGSSAVFERGFVTYSNEAKEELLGVPHELIVSHGAVSNQVVRAMLEGIFAQSRADLAVAITGIAGPAGGTEAKPVGLVYIAVRSIDGIADVRECRFDQEGLSGRDEIRRAAVRVALDMLAAQIS